MNDCCLRLHHEVKRLDHPGADSSGSIQTEKEILSAPDQKFAPVGDNQKAKMEVEEFSGRELRGQLPSDEIQMERDNSGFLKQVTDDSCESSEDTEKLKDSSSERRQSSRGPQHQETPHLSSQGYIDEPSLSTNAAALKGAQEASLEKEGPIGEHDQELSSNIRSPNLPQHERIQHVQPQDITYRCTPASLKLKDVLLSRLRLISPSGRIQVIDLSRRGLVATDAELISSTLLSNPQIAVLKLGYNNFGDVGTSVIATGSAKQGRHHQNLTVLDLGFNCVGDEGCKALSFHMVAGNHTLRNLFLSGNNINEEGIVALASAILHGCSLSRLHLSHNNLGEEGMKVLVQSIAEAETRVQQLLQRQGGIKIGYNIKPVTLEECNLDNVSMTPKSFETISNMAMANFNLKNISLANNNLNDSDLALLSQSLSQNKKIPLTSLILSFNEITCIGVECLMNAVWGSTTLKEIKLDSNKMQDRGAQLCSVVLTSIPLEFLDISFNKITTVGVKAIMKSLSENDSLRRLSLCGIPMDQNASKAVSYALAYNQSLQRLHIDSCSVGYSGQRHIVAGIVSNRYTKLQKLTGFPLAPITMTLGLPQLPEEWGNDRVLSFVRFMWTHWKLKQSAGHPKDIDEAADCSRGPAPPSMVATAAKRAFGSLSKSEESRMEFQKELQNQTDDNPMISPETCILVRSLSGNDLQIPSWEEELKEVPEPAEPEVLEESWSSEMESLDQSSYTASSSHISLQHIASVEHERRNRNLTWLRSHLQTLTDIRNLAFDDADLWRLHQYYFSPAYNAEDIADDHIGQETSDKVCNVEKEKTNGPPSAEMTTHAMTSDIKTNGLTISFETLGKAFADANIPVQRPNKRELHIDLGSAKRARKSTPRIAYYPRIKERLESQPSTGVLSLLRQLKYVENGMLEGRNIYSLRDQEEGYFPTTDDIEMVLLDLL